MFLCSLIEELCTKEENNKTGFNFNFGHECISADHASRNIKRLFINIINGI